MTCAARRASGGVLCSLRVLRVLKEMYVKCVVCLCAPLCYVRCVLYKNVHDVTCSGAWRVLPGWWVQGAGCRGAGGRKWGGLSCRLVRRRQAGVCVTMAARGCAADGSVAGRRRTGVPAAHGVVSAAPYVPAAVSLLCVPRACAGV